MKNSSKTKTEKNPSVEDLFHLTGIFRGLAQDKGNLKTSKNMFHSKREPSVFFWIPLSSNFRKKNKIGLEKGVGTKADDIIATPQKTILLYN